MKIKVQKKWNIAIVTLLILCVTIGRTVMSSASSSDTFIKIGLLYGNESLSSVELKSEYGFVLMEEQNRELIHLRSLSEYKTLFATIKTGVVVVTDKDGAIISNAFARDHVLMCAAEDREARFITINDAVYRDGVSLLPDANSGITIINNVTIEHYIKGVLNAEMSYAYPAEALKAQAVTARSYALANISKHSKYGFDLCASNCCQVYKGVSAEYPETNSACDATEGLVMSYGGEIVAGYYFANSGGYTQNSEDVWASPLGYLRAVKDDFAPLYSWSGQISFGDLKAKLEKKGYNPGRIKSVYIDQRYENGTVAELVIEGTNEKITLTKESIRTTLGSSVVKSTRFSMGSSENPEIKIGTAENILSVYASSGASSVKNPVYVISNDGQIKQTELDTLIIYDGAHTVQINDIQKHETEFTEETIISGQIFFSGLGYGHGVGMPQSSAREMAHMGYDYKDILRYFYTGITIEPLDGLLN